MEGHILDLSPRSLRSENNTFAQNLRFYVKLFSVSDVSPAEEQKGAFKMSNIYARITPLKSSSGGVKGKDRIYLLILRDRKISSPFIPRSTRRCGAAFCRTKS